MHLTEEREPYAERPHSGYRERTWIDGETNWEDSKGAHARRGFAQEHPTAEHERVMGGRPSKPRAGRVRTPEPRPGPTARVAREGRAELVGLVVQAPPLFIQEKVHPKALIADLLRHSKDAEKERAAEESGFQADLFADFNGLPSPDARTEFYQHDANWSNRMILGDSLQVMASLAEREGLRGKVQCIYIDPPYGIKFNSNFQWSTTSRE